MVKKTKKTVPQKIEQVEKEDYTCSESEQVSRNQSHMSNSTISNVTVTVTPNGKETNENNENNENNDNPVTIYVNKLNKYVETIAKMNYELKQLVTVGKTLEKDFNQIVKLLAKKNKNKSNENRALTGFAMPTYLTDEMYDFLNEHTEMKIESGQKVHRIAVTRTLNKYIKDNGLRQEKDKRYFTPNSTLHRIFRSTENDEVSYFNLQKYIKHHFLKEYKKV
tara:strand:- start:9229 stop:9894 length:666 start_codon:yes stop_codon:yes gene_type:complete